MIRIVNTNNKRNKINGKSDTEWRKAKSQIIPELNPDSCVPDSEIDAIAAAMDKADIQQNYELPQINNNLNPSKEEIAKLMVQQYVKQNGGVPLPDGRTKKNQVIID